MKLFWLALSVIILSFSTASSIDLTKTVKYKFSDDPIDVVIPSTEKDLPTLNNAIDGIKKFCKVRRVIVLSRNKLTDKAEWFNEAQFPFTKDDIALNLFKGDRIAATNYLKTTGNRLGWFLQQLLKLYAYKVIPGLSSNILILDSDTIFLKPISFIDEKTGGALFNCGTEFHKPYFDHMGKFIPGLRRLFSCSGITHHMLFQKPILDDLFDCVEKYHDMPFWQAFCRCVEIKTLFSGASEYEIYFNFALTRTSQVQIRPLKWLNTGSLDIDQYKNSYYDYVSCHTYMR